MTVLQPAAFYCLLLSLFLFIWPFTMFCKLCFFSRLLHTWNFFLARLTTQARKTALCPPLLACSTYYSSSLSPSWQELMSHVTRSYSPWVFLTFVLVFTSPFIPYSFKKILPLLLPGSLSASSNTHPMHQKWFEGLWRNAWSFPL